MKVTEGECRDAQMIDESGRSFDSRMEEESIKDRLGIHRSKERITRLLFFEPRDKDSSSGIYHGSYTSLLFWTQVMAALL
jgi:hypothetical protein